MTTMPTGSPSIELALLAIMSTAVGDMDAARVKLAEAQREWRSSSRRHRQVLEIAAVILAGRGPRAGDLALVHIEEFPADADLLAAILRCPMAPGRSWSVVHVRKREQDLL